MAPPSRDNYVSYTTMIFSTTFFQFILSFVKSKVSSVNDHAMNIQIFDGTDDGNKALGKLYLVRPDTYRRVMEHLAHVVLLIPRNLSTAIAVNAEQKSRLSKFDSGEYYVEIIAKELYAVRGLAKSQDVDDSFIELIEKMLLRLALIVECIRHYRLDEGLFCIHQYLEDFDFVVEYVRYFTDFALEELQYLNRTSTLSNDIITNFISVQTDSDKRIGSPLLCYQKLMTEKKMVVDNEK